MEGGATMNNIFDQDGHLKPEALLKLQNGSIDGEGMLMVAEHVGDCLECAGRLALCFEKGTLEKAPSGFTQSVKNRLPVGKKSNIQLGYYVLRVSVAVCAALIIVFSGALNSISGADNLSKTITAPSFGFVNQFNLSLRDFSQKIVTSVKKGTDFTAFNSHKSEP
jgi:hypothetical protein